MVLLALALGCGLVASIGISQVMERRNADQGPVSEMEPILIASADIHYNDLLTPEKVRFEEWPKGKVPPGALTKLDELQGQRSAGNLVAGEPILTGKLMGNDASGASRKIPKGYGVVSVAVDAVTGASSLIKPDDRVDLLLYMARRPEMGIEETSTRTILHDVRVFAVDKVFERAHGDDRTETAKTVSLLVTPEQAEKVTLATGLGTIRLVMRGPDDSSSSSSEGTNVSEIFGGKRPGEADATKAGPEFGLSGQPQQAAGAVPGAAAVIAAPGPAPIVAAPTPPATWTMVLLEGSEMRQVELSTSQFPVITSQRVDYQPDPTPPVEAPPVEVPDANASSDDGPPLQQPTAGDDGFGSLTEVPND
jgi:pilus assembly protein CpaB